MDSENSASTSCLVELQSVSFSYGQRAVLRNISLKVPKGKVIAIMGGSGSGKTTILRLIGGQVKANGGKVSVFGEDIGQAGRDDLYRVRRHMGMLFQFGALFTDLSVFDNVAFPLREQTDLDENSIRELVLMKLHAVGLHGAASLMPSEISGGMARRVALARAVILDPKLVLYDEPFSGLDPISLSVIARLIRQLSNALDASAVVVTHDVESSLNFVDYVYFISEGNIVAEGTPDEIRASRDPFVVQFVSAQPEGPIPFHYPSQVAYPDILLEEPNHA